MQDKPTFRLVTAAGLVAGAVGIGILYPAGVAMPVVPPGLVMLLVAAAVVAFAPWRWAPVVGVLAGLFEVAGFFGSGSAAALTDLGSLDVFAGTWIRGLGIVTAVVAGVVATRVATRSREMS
jgi:hypothetical protein